MLGPSDRDALREAGHRRRFPRGSVLFREGSKPDVVLLLEAGRIKIVKHGPDAEDVIAVRVPGELVGELAVIDGHPRSGTGIALEPVEAVSVPAVRFRELLEERPALTLSLLVHVIGSLREADRSRVEFGALDVRTRLVDRLVDLAHRFGEAAPDGGVRIALPLTQDDLAAWVGASREAVVKALRGLREDGLVETGRRELRVLDLAALRHRRAAAPPSDL